MQRKPFLITALLVAVTLAGCLGDDGPADPQTGGQNVPLDSSDPFFAGAYYSPGTFDPSTLSPAIYDALPVEQVYVTMSDGIGIENGVYRPDTDEPTPVFINFSPYHGDTATTRGDGFGQYLIDNYVARGYTIVLSSIRGTGQSDGCFEVASDREAMDFREVVDFFAEQPWSNGMVGAGGKSYDSTTQNGMIAKFPTDNLRAVFHVSGITDMYEYTFHHGIPARIDSAAFTTVYGAGQGVHEYGIAGSAGGDGSLDDEDAESLLRLAGTACVDTAEGIANPVASTLVGLKTPYWQERDWTTSIGESDWDGSIFFYHGFHDWNVQPSHILPWLDNLPEQINTKVWLHQDRENSGHLYPMRADWNLTMLRWLDSELKGVDNGIWSEPGAELQGSDGVWRAEAEFPPERAVMTEFKPVEGNSVNEWEFAIAGDEGLRYSGAPHLSVMVSSISPDPIISAVLYRMDVDGVRHWINEGTFRGILSDDLTSVVGPFSSPPRAFSIDFYAQDDVLAPGESWVLVFNDTPQKVVAFDPQLEGNVFLMDTAVLQMPLVPTNHIVSPQPEPTECFAC